MKKGTTMPCLIALGLLAAAAWLVWKELQQAPTMCSFCGSLACDGGEGCPGRARFVEAAALAKLDAAHGQQALGPRRASGLIRRRCRCRVFLSNSKPPLAYRSLLCEPNSSP